MKFRIRIRLRGYFSDSIPRTLQNNLSSLKIKMSNDFDAEEIMSVLSLTVRGPMIYLGGFGCSIKIMILTILFG